MLFIGLSVQACESSGRNILALEEDKASFNVFLRDIELVPDTDIEIEDSRALSLHQHIDELDGCFAQPNSHAALCRSSHGMAD